MAEFPLFSESYREHLVTVIEEHFLNREIGEESPDLFLLSVRRRLRRKMPLLNKMYVQSVRDIDPLITTDMFTESENESDSNSTSTSDGTTETTAENKSRGVASNNPNVRLAAGQDYASSMSDSTGKADSLAEVKQSDTNVSEGSSVSRSTMRGTNGSPADLIARYFDVLVNVDDMVLQELSICFMQMWNTSHSYSQSSRPLY